MNRSVPTLSGKKQIFSRKQETSLPSPQFNQKSEIVSKEIAPLERSISTRSTPTIGSSKTAPVENFLSSKKFIPHHLITTDSVRYIRSDTREGFPVYIEISDRDYTNLPTKSVKSSQGTISNSLRNQVLSTSMPETHGAAVICENNVCIVTKENTLFITTDEESPTPIPILHIEEVRSNPSLAETTVALINKRFQAIESRRAKETMDRLVTSYNTFHHTLLSLVKKYEEEENKENIASLSLISSQLSQLEEYILKATDLSQILEEKL